MTEYIEWDDRQRELEQAAKGTALSEQARGAVKALLAQGEAFNAVAFPEHGFGSQGAMDAVLGPAEEGETAVVLALRRVLAGEGEKPLHDAIAKCRRLYVVGLSKRGAA